MESGSINGLTSKYYLSCDLRYNWILPQLICIHLKYLKYLNEFILSLTTCSMFLVEQLLEQYHTSILSRPDSLNKCILRLNMIELKLS